MKGAGVERDATVAVVLGMSKLAGKKRNALRVVAVPDAVERAASLLHAASDEACNLLIKKLATASRR